MNVDLTAEELLIYGQGFNTGKSLRVVLGDVDITGSCVGDLVVIPQTIICNLSGRVPTDGDYLLTVATGGGASQYDEYDLTIGAVGPAGISGYEVVRGPTSSYGSVTTLSADCPAGKKVLGGGGSQGSFGWYIDDSRPKSDGSGWQVQYAPSIAGSPGGGIGEAWAICAIINP